AGSAVAWAIGGAHVLGDRPAVLRRGVPRHGDRARLVGGGDGLQTAGLTGHGERDDGVAQRRRLRGAALVVDRDHVERVLGAIGELLAARNGQRRLVGVAGLHRGRPAGDRRHQVAHHWSPPAVGRRPGHRDGAVLVLGRGRARRRIGHLGGRYNRVRGPLGSAALGVDRIHRERVLLTVGQPGDVERALVGAHLVGRLTIAFDHVLGDRRAARWRRAP